MVLTFKDILSLFTGRLNSGRNSAEFSTLDIDRLSDQCIRDLNLPQELRSRVEVRRARERLDRR